MTRHLRRIPTLALLVVALAATGPAPAAAQSGPDVMRKQRELQRVKDEEEPEAELTR
jgi:hypothetical protein